MSLLTYRLLSVLVLVAGFGTAAVVLSLRYYVLPNIDQHRERIAALASEAIGQPVTIGGIAAQWNGLRPHLSMARVVVHDGAGRPALELQRVEATLSWRSMLVGRAGTRMLEIIEPSLTIRRDAQGGLWVAGLPVAGGDEDAGFGRWVLAQRSIVIRHASVVWVDEARGAPDLWLKKVALRLESGGRRHRLGVTAVPPDGLAAPFDLRAEWRGDDLSRLAEWEGRVFVELRDTSLSGWEAWIDLPGGVESGTGAVRLWADMQAGRLVSLVSDVELAGVRARLAPGLATLAFDEMGGRLGWRQLQDGFELVLTRLALSQPGLPATSPTVARLRWHDPSARPAGGALPTGATRGLRSELTASSLEIAPWVALASQLPLDPQVHRLLAALAPSGRLSDVSIAWEGPVQSPSGWQVKGRFDKLSVAPHAKWPGLSGISGSIDGSEAAGSLRLDSEAIRVTLPAVFPRPLAFDTLSGQFGWSGQGPKLAIRMAGVAFANADLAGTLSGEVRPLESKFGHADLTAALSRAQARAVAGYMPFEVSADTRTWLARALVAGQSTDVRMRLKGHLEDFPFSDPKRNPGSQFLVTVKAQGVELDYAPGWPRITDIDGDIVFRGERMEILPKSGTLAGVRLQRVRAIVPDIVHSDEILEVSGEAESATADFLRFIAQSPVDGLLDGATRQMEAQGRGRLALRMVLPLRHMVDTTVSGSYQFIGNRLALDPDAPVLDAVNGRLEFTETGIRVNGATAQVFGGPAAINVASQRDGTVRVGVSGQATAELLARELPDALGQALRGSTEWRATVNYRRKVGDLVVESSLAGLAIDLPPPFGKAAAETLPLRIEQVSGVERDRIAVTAGSVLAAQVLRRLDAGQATIERASIVVGGGPAPVPERRGISVSGALSRVDVDAWRPLLASLPDSGKGGPALGDINLRIGQVEVIGRRFNDVVLKTVAQPGGWDGSIASKEVSGDLAWRSQGRGRLVARLSQINLPPAQATQAVLQQAKFDEVELPALDVTVERFLLADRALGRLELAAQPEGRDWRIDRLRVVNPDATFHMEGLWQSWTVQPRTQVKVRLDIVDGGRLLARLGYPEGVRGAAGRIEGPLSWAGSPQDLDVATLGGTLQVDMSKGQFATLEPGVGRLLGVFNLQHLPRRIALDFRDVFSEGFSFDEISGSMRIARGAGRLENFRIQGPSARVLMSGEVNLAKETQNLQVRVTPVLGDSVALAGALLGGPVAGIATFLVQRVLKDPLAQLATFDYAVTGTWAEPAVNRLPRQDPGNGPAPSVPAPG